MNFIDKMVERFTRLNRRLKRWRRGVSVLAAIVVFATTYALVLPAITLDKETASTQAGMEIAAEQIEPEETGTVYESEPEETDSGSESEPAESEDADAAPAMKTKKTAAPTAEVRRQRKNIRKKSLLHLTRKVTLPSMRKTLPRLQTIPKRKEALRKILQRKQTSSQAMA